MTIRARSGPADPALFVDQVRAGDRLPALPAAVLVDLEGRTVPIPDPDNLVHLQLRRFAGCPVCNLHLRSVVRRHDEIRAAGIREVVVFHSTVEDLLPHAHDLPFPVVADPHKVLYRLLGAASSRRALLDPRAWPTIVHAVAVALGQIVRGRGRPPALFPRGGRYGLPADLLVAPDGTVVAARYGRHVDDQWSVDDLLAHAGTRPATSPDRHAARSDRRHGAGQHEPGG